MTEASNARAARELKDQIDKITDDLAYRYDGTFNRNEVQEVVNEASTALTRGIKVTTYLPILVSRHARELLEAKAIGDGKVAKQKPELLFISAHNADRSRIAAALARHLSNQRVHVRWASVSPTAEINPVVKEVLDERGIPIPEAHENPLDDSPAHVADVTVTMGGGDASPDYPGKIDLHWKVDDPTGASKQRVRAIIDGMQVLITALLDDILHKDEQSE